MQLYLIRHTQPAIESGICYGQSDLCLAESFKKELEDVQKKIQALKPAAAFSSPLQRCQKLAIELGLQNLKLDARLMELNFGAWEMQAWTSIPKQEWDNWCQNFSSLAPPDGEAFCDLFERVSAFTTELEQSHNGDDVLVITHSGVIRALLAKALNLPLTEVFRFQVDYGSVSRVDFGRTGSSVAYVNR
jgi:alpha-ribazole phosphatase